MRKAASKLHWQGRGVLVALALVVGILGLVLLYSTVRADAPQSSADASTEAVDAITCFNADASTDVVDTTTCANSDIGSTFSVDKEPWPSLMYSGQVSFTPGGWGVAAGEDISIGAIVGKLDSHATLGWFNNPCADAYGGHLDLSFDPLMNCSNDRGDTVSFDDQFITDANGLPKGCNKYPDFLNTMFPGMQPRARYGGFENASGIWVSLNFVVFEPGTSLPLPGLPAFGADKGYVAMSVLNDPTGPLVKNQITDLCPPLATETTYYGLTKDNPATGDDESGKAWRTNPTSPGSYTFWGYANSIPDADGDCIDNELDTCPHIACADIANCDPTVLYSGDADGDGLSDACDPDDADAKADPDGDGFPNYQDLCPLVSDEDQTDSDYDRIGDACDKDDWNNDGDTDDPGEPTGFVNGTTDGERAEVWFETDIVITEGVCPTPTPTATPTGTPGAEGSPTAAAGTATATATGTVVAAAETTLAEDAKAGDKEITVDDATGFAVGDTIEIGTGDTKETNTITAISDKTFTLATALEFDHLADEPVVKVIPVVLTPTPTVVGEICQPVFPGTYNGRVLIDGKPAESGWRLTASIDDVQWGSAIISGGRYAMDVPDHMPTHQPCFEGGTIVFALNGMTCTPVEEGTDEWHAGIRNVDLDCAPVAPPVTPTVTPPATPTTPPAATPTVTPAKPPYTGAGGLSGSSAGLPLWATALAGWAGLMIVAGLGALMAAKRR